MCERVCVWGRLGKLDIAFRHTGTFVYQSSMDIVTRKASHLHASTWPDVVGHQGFLQGGRVCVCEWVCVCVCVFIGGMGEREHEVFHFWT